MEGLTDTGGLFISPWIMELSQKDLLDLPLISPGIESLRHRTAKPNAMPHPSGSTVERALADPDHPRISGAYANLSSMETMGPNGREG